MGAVVKKLYEAMFLVDSAEAGTESDGVSKTVKDVLERAEAEIVSIRKWDECKLAYEIKGKTRGTYILYYFRANGERIHDIERDVQLSERIMRVLILNAEAMSQEDIEKDTPATRTEKHKRKIAQEAAGKAEAKQVIAQEAAGKAEAKRVIAQEAAGKAEAKQVIAQEATAEAVTADASGAPDRSEASESEQPEQAEASPSEGRAVRKDSLGEAEDRGQRTEDREQKTEKSDF